MWEIRLPSLVGLLPLLQHHIFQPSHGFHFWYASVCYPVHVSFQECLLFLGRKVSIIWNTLIIVVRYQIENVLFQVSASTADGMDFRSEERRVGKGVRSRGSAGREKS